MPKKFATTKKSIAVLVVSLLIVSTIFTTVGIFLGKAIHWSKESLNNSTVSPPNSTQTPKNEYLKFQENTTKIIHTLTNGSLQGYGWDFLANLTDTFGPRLFGSQPLENAIDFILEKLNQVGFDNVHKEPVPNKQAWKRGTETATLLTPRVHKMAIIGLGRTPQTKNGLSFNAEAIVVRSFQELEVKGKASLVKGKIVVFNEPWLGSYGSTVAYRYSGEQVKKYGGLASLVRSVTPFSVYSVHTGTTTRNLEIPVAAITVEDAEMLWRMQQRGQKLIIQLLMQNSWHTTTSHNVVFEIQGKEKPEEIVLLSGHIDSWDVGEGAMDDGGGCISMMMGMLAIKSLNVRPKRTIRGVFFTGEEVGYIGANQYYNDHKNETFVFVSESDEGAFRPRSPNATFLAWATDNDLIKMNQMADLMRSNGIPFSVKSGSVDIGEPVYWTKQGVPGFYYINMDTYNYYFTFHHTNGDTMTVLKPDDIDYVSALYGSFANIIANMDTNFSQKPYKKNNKVT